MNIKQLVLLGFMAQSSLAFAHDPFHTDGDSTKKAPKNWFNLDPITDHVPGVSTEKAYKKLLKNKKSKTVIVAVIDSGIDIEHEDLKGNIWVNTKEIAGNGKDDDGNGYVDDIHGWNFLGDKNGKHVEKDTYELTRVYKTLSKKYANKSMSEATDTNEFQYFQEIKKEFESKRKDMEKQLIYYKELTEQYRFSERLMKAYLNLESDQPLSLEELNTVGSSDIRISQSKQFIAQVLEQGYSMKNFQEAVDHFKSGLEYGYNVDFDPRNIVGDNYSNYDEIGYGNNLVEGPDAEHGTHVAGIIAANRINNLGMKGIAKNVKIMAIRAVPSGDERDKDISNAIRYAVDNGAQIINMSFGKAYSPGKKYVDKAVKYAASKNVLLIHAAGNESKNLDNVFNFPNSRYMDNSKSAPNWIEVGACSWKGGINIPAEFSNYGQKNVDVFAPGVSIYATTPDDNYKSMSGTSMAAPVVSGVAALIISYYPNLSAQKVKKIIMDSAIDYGKEEVIIPGKDEKTTFKKLSITGGVINAYRALKLASKKSKRR